MLELIDYDNIRRLDQDGWSVRRIAKYLKRSRDTVRKALEWDGTPLRYHLSKPRQRASMTPEVVEFVKVILKKDCDAPFRFMTILEKNSLTIRWESRPCAGWSGN